MIDYLIGVDKFRVYWPNSSGDSHNIESPESDASQAAAVIFGQRFGWSDEPTW